MNAVVLLSGGLDSTTLVADVVHRGFEAHALSFRYGQRHLIELVAAERVARHYRVRQDRIVDIDLRAFGGSALTSDLPVPRDRSPDEIAGDTIPITYVPARNTIFLAFATAYAEVVSARDVFIGVNALDYSGYPDCRPEFIAAFQRVANLGTRGGVDGSNPVAIHAPLVDMTKAEIIRRGLELGVDYSMTSSCYDPDASGLACGHCDACILRRQGFDAAGVADPTRYRG